MKKALNRIYRTIMVTIIVSGLVFITLWAFGIVTVVRGHGPSMEPTLSDGELYLQVKVDPQNIKRGDIIGAVLENGTRVTKRVIGLPGEHICIGYSIIWADGDWIAEPYLEWPGWNDFGEFDASFTLGPDEYFIMGDNRAESQSFAITGEQILGEVILK